MRFVQQNQRRAGFALPVAVLALVVVGVLVTGGFFMAQQETRVGVASQQGSMAFYIAEQGMNEVLGNWAAAQYASIPLWGADTVTGSITQGGYTVQIHHLTDYMYFLESVGTVTQGGLLSGAMRKVGLLARIQTAWINPPGALTTRGDTNVRGTSTVSGIDTNPTGWTECGVDLENRPGIITDSAGTVQRQGTATIAGDPDTLRDETMGDSTFLDYGELNWDDLVAIAEADGKNVTSVGSTMRPVPTLTGSAACNTGSMTNWGEPWRSTLQGTDYKEACTGYFPLIYHDGPVTLNAGGRGQGILLVLGNIRLNGLFEFNGIIITQGAYEAQGGPGNAPRITGGVMASNATLGDEVIAGGSTTQYSSCAIEQAILNNASLAKARPVQNRSWVDLTNVRR